jgi:hypothetical protein
MSRSQALHATSPNFFFLHPHRFPHPFPSPQPHHPCLALTSTCSEPIDPAAPPPAGKSGSTPPSPGCCRPSRGATDSVQPPIRRARDVSQSSMCSSSTELSETYYGECKRGVSVGGRVGAMGVCGGRGTWLTRAGHGRHHDGGWPGRTAPLALKRCISPSCNHTANVNPPTIHPPFSTKHTAPRLYVQTSKLTLLCCSLRTVSTPQQLRTLKPTLLWCLARSIWRAMQNRAPGSLTVSSPIFQAQARESKPCFDGWRPSSQK